MDSDEEIMYDDYDSGNESSGDDDVEFAMVEEPNNPKERQELDEYPYEVLTTEQILQHMNDCIKEVNIVVEVWAKSFYLCYATLLTSFSFQMPSTVIRMLLNHFRWDKEKLMERYYDGDPEKLFTEAHVASPFAKAAVPAKVAKKDQRRAGPSVEECEVRLFSFIKTFTVFHPFFIIFNLDLFIYLTFVCDVWVGVWAPFLCLLLG